MATAERLAHYVRPDELHLSFNFGLVLADWDLTEFRQAIDEALTSTAQVGAPSTWVLSNHDIVRHATRYGGGTVGRARARAAAMVQLALPGAAYIYNGDELGLENVELPDEVLQDPSWERSGHTERGRDGERVPLPWDGSAAPYGFTTGRPWLPMPPDWAARTVAAELADPDSTLSLYREMLRIRRARAELTHAEVTWVGAPDGCLALRRGDTLLVIANMGDVPAELPVGRVLLASGPLAASRLPPDSAVWLDVG